MQIPCVKEYKEFGTTLFMAGRTYNVEHILHHGYKVSTWLNGNYFRVVDFAWGNPYFDDSQIPKRY